jgi:hypothetical protein
MHDAASKNLASRVSGANPAARTVRKMEVPEQLPIAGSSHAGIVFPDNPESLIAGNGGMHS